MFLRIIINDLSANDADYYLRELTKTGAHGSISFGDAFHHRVIITQAGPIEKLLETASIAFHTTSFRVEISG